MSNIILIDEIPLVDIDKNQKELLLESIEKINIADNFIIIATTNYIDRRDL